MTKYKISIQLTLEYLYPNTMDFSKEKKLVFEEYSFIEPKTKASITIDSNFNVTFAELMAENDDKAMIIVNNLLEKLCRKLTMIIELQSAENEPCQPNLSFNISKAKITEKSEFVDVNKVPNTNKIICRDNMGIHDALSIMVSHHISLEKYGFILSNEPANESALFMDILYRAARCRDIASKYFTLFTMIEYIETKYIQYIKTQNMLDDDKMSQLKNWLDENFEFDDKTYKDRLTNRINSILRSATIETRAEKLCEIIKQTYKITSISQSLTNYDITPAKMDQFIKMRNKIVHGSTMSDFDSSEKITITNELLFLCQKIVEFETHTEPAS